MHTVKKPHIGNNVRRLMNALDIKQDTLATGLEISQQQVSRLLQKDTIDDKLLDQIAEIMDISADAIKNYSEEAMVQFISNDFTITTHDSSNQATYQFQPTFNYADKLLAYMERELKLKDELIESLRKEIEELRHKSPKK